MKFTCRQGHEWHLIEEEFRDGGNGILACPICGSEPLRHGEQPSLGKTIMAVIFVFFALMAAMMSLFFGLFFGWLGILIFGANALVMVAGSVAFTREAFGRPRHRANVNSWDRFFRP